EGFDMVRRHAGRVAHAHIADTDRRPPGQGDWPLREFLTALREGGYRGAVSIECVWADLAAEAGDALAALRAADSRRTPDAPPAARTATVTDNGGRCWFQVERALVHPHTGTLLLCAVASPSGPAA